MTGTGGRTGCGLTGATTVETRVTHGVEHAHTCAHAESQVPHPQQERVLSHRNHVQDRLQQLYSHTRQQPNGKTSHGVFTPYYMAALAGRVRLDIVHALEGHRFDSWSGHVPSYGLSPWSGHVQEAAD